MNFEASPISASDSGFDAADITLVDCDGANADFDFCYRDDRNFTQHSEARSSRYDTENDKHGWSHQAEGDDPGDISTVTDVFDKCSIGEKTDQVDRRHNHGNPHQAFILMDLIRHQIVVPRDCVHGCILGNDYFKIQMLRR